MASIVDTSNIESQISSSNGKDHVEETSTSLETKLSIDDSSESKNNDKSKNGSEENLLNIDAKQRKKLDKLVDGLFKKSTNNKQAVPASLEEKFYVLAQKYVDSQEQNKKLQLAGKEGEKTMSNLSKQRDQIQSEYGKTLLVKTKLESLCRELQRQNKLVKEESIQRIEEEEKKRKEISNKFQGAIDEINQSVASNSEKNNTLIQENVQLTTKLKNLIDQYEVREQHIEKVLKHKDLEIQLANAKLQQSELKIVELTERSKKEKTIYDTHILELTKKCEFHQESENQLKSQVQLYTQKYEEFQSTLAKSNQVFESFRSEMDKLTKKIKKLEQETAQWKLKWEQSDAALKTCLAQKEEIDEKAKKAQSKADIMEQLSRSLQTERNSLKQAVKELEEKLNLNNGEPKQAAEQQDEAAPPVVQSNTTEQEQNNQTTSE